MSGCSLDLLTLGENTANHILSTSSFCFDKDSRPVNLTEVELHYKDIRNFGLLRHFRFLETRENWNIQQIQTRRRKQCLDK